MKLATKLFAVSLLLPVSALASPFVISDPVDPAVTDCGIFLDAAPKQTVPVTLSGTSKICKFDIAGIANGAHTIKATAIINDSIWGVLESPQSVPLSFTKPASPAAPATLRLAP
jgi:hypothetical protein